MDLQRKSKVINFFAILIVLLILLFLFNYKDLSTYSRSYLSAFSFNSSELEKSFASAKEFHGLESFFESSMTNILILVTDAPSPRNYASFNGRTDFMMLLSLNHENNKVRLLSIPRDTYLDVDRYGFSRINFANSVGGVNKVKETVSKLLGLEVDHYLMLNINGFKRIIDEFGDLKIYVTKEMHYEDKKAGLKIDFEPGLETMNSDELIEFLRYRDNIDGDIGRIKRQHIFFRALLHKFTMQDIIVRLPYLMTELGKICLTDINLATSMDLIKSCASVFQEGFESFIIPGDFGRNGYWIIDNKALSSLLQYILAK